MLFEFCDVIHGCTHLFHMRIRHITHGYIWTGRCIFVICLLFQIFISSSLSINNSQMLCITPTLKRYLFHIYSYCETGQL